MLPNLCKQRAKPAGGAAASHRIWWRKATQIYLCLVVGVLALEAVFNLAGIGQSEIVQPDQKLGCVHIRNKPITWRLEGYSRDRLNSVGMRDIEHTLTKPAGIKRIAFLGDSYTEGLQVPRADTFAAKVGQILQSKHYETLNFGCSSYSTGQELLVFNRQVKAYKPDLVVLFYTPGDTAENCVAIDQRFKAEARPYFYLDEDNQLKQDDGVLRLNAEKLRPRPLREFLRTNSTIFGAYHQTIFSLALSDKVYFRTVRLIDQLYRSTANTMARLMHHSQRPKTPPDGLFPPRWQDPDKLAVSEALISRFNEDVQTAGAKFVLLTYPDQGSNDASFALARAHFARLAKEKDFGYLDLSQAFDSQPNFGKLFVKVHFSKLGHDLTARELSTYLKTRGLLTD